MCAEWLAWVFWALTVQQVVVSGGAVPLCGYLDGRLEVILQNNAVLFVAKLPDRRAVKGEVEGFNSYGSSLLILLAYVPSMPPLLSMPLSMACDDSDGCVAMVIDAYAILARQHAAVLAAMSNLLILRK
ncbi:hypothetical protein Tco_0740900 [Tanacetum coccineum]